MLTLLIDTTIGFIAAGTLASIGHSALSFLPTWQKLQADLKACDNPGMLQVTIRDFAYAPEDAKVGSLASGAVIYRHDFGGAESGRNALSPPRSQSSLVGLRAAA